MSARNLKLVQPAGEQSILETALAIAEERENNTRDLCRAVLREDYAAAQKLAKELLPNESVRTHKSINRRAGR